MNIILLDCGTGETEKTVLALKQFGVDPILSNNSMVWKKADAIILSSSGSLEKIINKFGDGLNALDIIVGEVGVPFLGINT